MMTGNIIKPGSSLYDNCKTVLIPFNIIRLTRTGKIKKTYSLEKRQNNDVVPPLVLGSGPATRPSNTPLAVVHAPSSPEVWMMQGYSHYTVALL